MMQKSPIDVMCDELAANSLCLVEARQRGVPIAAYVEQIVADCAEDYAEIIDGYGLERVRQCGECGRLMTEGWLVGGNEYACSESCLYPTLDRLSQAPSDAVHGTRRYDGWRRDESGKWECEDLENTETFYTDWNEV